MNKFDERKKGFEEKYARDEELKFKIDARRNKYLGQWVSKTFGYNSEQEKEYIQAVIKADFHKPGDEDVFKKIKSDFEKASIPMQDSEIRNQMKITLDRAKKDFI